MQQVNVCSISVVYTSSIYEFCFKQICSENQTNNAVVGFDKQNYASPSFKITCKKKVSMVVAKKLTIHM